MSPEKSANNQLESRNQEAKKEPHRSVDRLRIDATTYGSTIVLVVGIIITAIFQPVFLTVSNIANVLSQIAVLGILTMAQTIVLISGGIDLSVGSNVALSGVAAGLLFMHGVPLWIDCIVALGCATIIGVINGLLIAQNRAHPFIITLGMLTLLEGIAELITGGSPVNDMGALATTLGGTIFFGIPTAVVLLFVIVVLTALFLARTPLGRAAYAIGGNEEASYLSGIPIKRTKIYIYTLAGVIAGIAALTLSGILNAAEANIGTGLELQSIAAAVIGGTPLIGGRGGAWRSLQGVLLLGVVSNSLNLMSVGANYQNIALGIIVLIAVMVQKNR
ncbi:MAG: ABC transporter permease [Verrucomicrobia bacterium]|nr:ABC transporter permease [Verrucomicrobiota bacterium]MBV9298812.1 ABC transporter permease [Verrucomicrobiota bacterium]MBV9643179.1 ABC transporter permease [Verrucomicrobiota bacterium]